MNNAKHTAKHTNPIPTDHLRDHAEQAIKALLRCEHAAVLWG
jgi:hypothetical protein